MIPYQSSTTSEILEEHIHDVIHFNSANSTWIPLTLQAFSAPSGARRTPALRIEYDCIKGT